LSKRRHIESKALRLGSIKTSEADDIGGKENSAKRNVATPRKKKGANTAMLVESDQNHEHSRDDEPLAVNIGGKGLVQRRM